MLRTEAIKTFLTKVTVPDLANLYNHDMECQLLAAQDGGEIINKSYRGKKYRSFSDGITTWKSFRIPRNAASEPEYTDTEMTWDIGEHTEGIGLTGWDWKHRVSKWVAFDFDSMMNHAKGLSADEIETIIDSVKDISWITIRQSTSGNGLHLYVFLNDIPTNNHTEHAALARAILGKLSALAGHDFSVEVDTCGGNMWVWHRKMCDTDGLKLTKDGDILDEIPPNWRDHLKVVGGKKKVTTPDFVSNPKDFNELVGRHARSPLDPEHKELIKHLEIVGAKWWWSDHKMLITHTVHLKEAHNDLGLRGVFKTNSEGRERGNDHNCFLFPLRNGSWVVRRFSLGVQEASTWDQDGTGWTRCYYNREPDLKIAARCYGGVEDSKGKFIFNSAEMAKETCLLLGVNVVIPPKYYGRKCKLKQHKDGRLIFELERDDKDNTNEMSDWVTENKRFERVFNTKLKNTVDEDIQDFDDIVRHIISDETGRDSGWMIKIDKRWINEPLSHVKAVLASQDVNFTDQITATGNSILKAWKIVNKPFEPEYLGDRQWNYNAAQFKFTPTKGNTKLKYDNWTRVLNHCGKGLDKSLQTHPWGIDNNIRTGGDYLKCWIASLFQEPMQPLPYIFFHGPQDSGKSIFHEALEQMFTKGYVLASSALTNQGSFTGELENAVLCAVEETDLRSNKNAYNRIKEWVTAQNISIHIKGKTPFHLPNSTHWVHCANNSDYCPIFPGDTRITMIYVSSLDSVIPKKVLLPALIKEGPDFLSELLALELPPATARLNIPVIETEEKRQAEKANKSFLELYIEDECYYAKGHYILFKELYEKFYTWLEPTERFEWKKVKTGRELIRLFPQYPKGNQPGTNQVIIGNISWEPNERKKLPLLVLHNNNVVVSED